jgi:aryl-alcohol dehydrogenase-like predicted oxidoreductase
VIAQRVRLGDLGIKRIGLGTNRLRNTDENVAFIRAAVGAGVQMIDPAHLYCTREGIVSVPFYPLHGESSRALRDTAKRHGATEKQVMLAWLLARSPVMLPIPGTLSLAHLEENLGAFSLELSEAEFKELA